MSKYNVGDKVKLKWHNRYYDGEISGKKGALNNTVVVKFMDGGKLEEIETHISNIKLVKKGSINQQDISKELVNIANILEPKVAGKGFSQDLFALANKIMDNSNSVKIKVTDAYDSLLDLINRGDIEVKDSASMERFVMSKLRQAVELIKDF